MRKNLKLTNRFLSLLLSLALLISCLPAISLRASASQGDRVADPSTMDSWKEYYLPENGDLSTENAGGIWTDKSVFLNAEAFADTGIVQDSKDSFLVALSAIGSNKTVTGVSNVPTDTIFVLDLSRSMDEDVDELAAAADESIAALLKLNSNNRVGVVVYSSAASTSVLLPLGHYEAGADGKFLVYSQTNVTSEDGGRRETVGCISVAEGVTDSAGQRVTGTGVQNTGTYIQYGLILALEQFQKVTDITVQDAALGTIQRHPVLVLMTDGDPTRGDPNFTDPSSTPPISGNTSAALGFITQLTAAYTKNRIEEKYTVDCLFYSLGFNVQSGSVAENILDPQNVASTSNTTAINAYWSTYQSRGSVNIGGNRVVSKIDIPLSNDYVDAYFASTSSSGLAASFQEVVKNISLQSKYYPTLVDGNEDLSGYISFVDRIGKYMQVTDVKGLLINNQLYSGAELARNFVSGSADLGAEMLNAVMTRLSLESPEQAQSLIDLAYAYGQLSYTDANNYSNYIGWYANQAGQFLGFWHEGMETLPDPNDPAYNDETRPVYIIKSYGYLGAVDAEHGVEESDMMYATVQVRQNILTGEQYVVFAVPATLIPLVSYQVTLDEAGNLTALTASGATEPIRLVYEVALDESINAFNVLELDAQYLQANTDEDGLVSFYSNQYDVQGVVGYNTVNAYSYFNPSRQNDRYYYLDDTLIYQDQQGTLYESDLAPAGTLYRKHQIYQKVDGVLSVHEGYHQLTEAILETAVQTPDAKTWYIPMGSVRADYESYAIYKGGVHSEDALQNLTGTLIYANLPFVDAHDHTLGDLGYNYIVGATLGNNGKLTLTPETGIKLSKQMADGASAEGSFHFLLTNLSANDNSAYPAYLVDEQGNSAELQVQFSQGEAEVTLEAGQTLYIGGMTDGHQIRIREVESVDYKVESINGEAASEITVAVESNTMAPAVFVNDLRGKGNLVVAKEIAHDYGTEYAIPADKVFEITVTLEGIGVANADIPAKLTGSSIESIHTDANGSFTVSLKHDQHLELFDLAEGVIATVVEMAPGEGFEPAYWDNGVLGDGVVEIVADSTVSVIVVNDYSAKEVTGSGISVGGDKLLKWYVSDLLADYPWQADYSFQFQLQKIDSNGLWQTIATDKVLGSDSEKSFDFDHAMDAEVYSEVGSYNYRIIENRENPLDGFDYDLSVHSFTVEVADADMDGKLEIQSVISSREAVQITQSASGWDVRASFTNIYAPDSSNQVSVEIHKLVNNPTGSPEASLRGFQFALYADGVPAVQSEITNTHGVTRLILGPYEAPATYQYILQEVVPAEVPAGWSYSQQAITVTVVVEDTGDGHLVAKISQQEASDQDTDSMIYVSFTNTYDPKDAELEIDFVSKGLTGRALAAGEFAFEIRPYGSEEAVLSGKNDAEGNVIFDGKLVFDQVGIYHFDVVETSQDGNGITTDKNVYRVTVTVSDGKDGSLAASYVMLNSEGDRIVFKNTYTTAPVSVSISGSKTLVGRPLLNDEFTFILQEALDAQGTVNPEAEPVQTKNFADGSIHFPAITYTQAGSYYYVVSERNESSGKYGIRYDDAIYIVTVQVQDDGEGKLIAQEPVIVKQGQQEPAAGISFTNVYVKQPDDLAVLFGIQKTVNNLGSETIGPEDFLFQLEDLDTGEKQTVVSDSAGAAVFGLMYSEADAGKVFRYKITEVNDGREDVKYSQAEYLVEVSIILGQDNELTAAIRVDEAEVDTVLCQFVNEYGKGDDGPPYTADSGMLFMWMALLFVSGGCMAFMTCQYKKKENE